MIERFSYQDVTGFKFWKPPFGSAKMASIIYFVDGLLIDTGHSNMRSEIRSTVQQLGVNQLFITHHHEDHTGNVAELQAHFNVEAFASLPCCEVMKAPPPISLAQKLLWGSRPAYHQLNEIGSNLQTEKFNFNVIPIPGHAADMVALYEPTMRWLFSADLFINTRINYMLEGESILQQIKSIEKVLALDFDVLFCAHNPQLSNSKEKLKVKLDFLRQFYNDVEHHYSEGHSALSMFKLLHLDESYFVKILSGGMLSKLNMVKAAMRDLESSK